MTPFLTVKQASELTGKSPSSIRRIIYPIIEDDAHPDRAQIQPSVEEVQQLRMKGENFPWRVSEELLRREVRVEPTVEKGIAPAKSFVSENTDLLAMLRTELEIKNQQIKQQAEANAKLMEVISGLSERLREGNVLMGSLQQRLALPDGRSKNAATVDAKRPASRQPEKGSSIPAKAKPKKRFFSRFFRQGT